MAQRIVECSSKNGRPIFHLVVCLSRLQICATPALRHLSIIDSDVESLHVRVPSLDALHVVGNRKLTKATVHCPGAYIENDGNASMASWTFER